MEHHPFPSDLEADAVVVATPRGTQLEAVEAVIQARRPAVLVGNGLAETIAVLHLAGAAARAGVPVVVGAGFAPGFSCVLAAHGRSWFDTVREMHVSKAGTGGPACALVHHRALSRRSYDWREDGWVRRAGGPGRELAWFPAPGGTPPRSEAGRTTYPRIGAPPRPTTPPAEQQSRPAAKSVCLRARRPTQPQHQRRLRRDIGRLPDTEHAHHVGARPHRGCAWLRRGSALLAGGGGRRRPLDCRSGGGATHLCAPPRAASACRLTPCRGQGHPRLDHAAQTPEVPAAEAS